MEQGTPGDILGQSSMEAPAFTRRTFDWLSTSLLKGMSREDDKVIF
ncbi:hypothetical protein AB7M16_004935 [Bradyrhizobium sp. USDA 372]